MVFMAGGDPFVFFRHGSFVAQKSLAAHNLMSFFFDGLYLLLHHPLAAVC